MRGRSRTSNEVGVTVTPADVRAFIGRRLLEQTESSEERLGSIRLRPHQRTAVNRLRAAIREFGGALLCDQVGMGKTFVALALCDGEACVVGPAVLEDMWRTAAESAGRSIQFVSAESLSRSDRALAAGECLVIVDEAHHFRNPATKRYAALAKLVATNRIVMLTATPVHNRKKRSDCAAVPVLWLELRVTHTIGVEQARRAERNRVRRRGVRFSVNRTTRLVQPALRRRNTAGSSRSSATSAAA